MVRGQRRRKAAWPSREPESFIWSASELIAPQCARRVTKAVGCVRQVYNILFFTHFQYMLIFYSLYAHMSHDNVINQYTARTQHTYDVTYLKA